MPTYEYECSACGAITESFAKIAERQEKIPCQKCNNSATFIISKPMVLVDSVQDVPWLADFASKRKEARFGQKPIETRTEYKQYLKDHDLRPADAENLSEV